MAASVEMMYSVAASLPPQVTNDPRGFSLNCIIPDALVAGLLSQTMEVQLITSAQIEIKTEASNAPAQKTLKITGGLINVCSAYILMMNRYLDAEKAAGLVVQSPQTSQSVVTSQSPGQNWGQNDALSKALDWMTELQSSSTVPAPTLGLNTAPAFQSSSMPALGLPSTAFNPLQFGANLPGLPGQEPPMQQTWQQPIPQPHQMHQIPGQGADGTAQAVAFSQQATALLQQQGLPSNDPKVKEMTQLQEHLNALQAQVAAQNLRQ